MQADLPCRRRIAAKTAGIIIFIFLILTGSETAGTETNQANQIHASHQVTFYHTYGYRKDGFWNIPMHIWAHEKPGTIMTTVTERSEAI